MPPKGLPAPRRRGCTWTRSTSPVPRSTTSTRTEANNNKTTTNGLPEAFNHRPLQVGQGGPSQSPSAIPTRAPKLNKRVCSGSSLRIPGGGMAGTEDQACLRARSRLKAIQAAAHHTIRRAKLNVVRSGRHHGTGREDLQRNHCAKQTRGHRGRSRPGHRHEASRGGIANTLA
ncbi:hypothetical protein CCMA1212_005110 [Trichoderma ghanense]|uniref:Uncharacterized protein n=1 Tax=Trichoderma ghanense TaxID=65468 RepID=A0ABY2H6R9_9HYPO